ncbi:DDB1- and CUL4-associated factor 17 [Polypterus senegalus]|uniref:DDB1- and CUL4-associated factor 17 n=1 Tax=Polypterus senegalus TaxID=55291 RepID=UPI001963FC64|nr:DDB1- and CUL4-associated factor 17 [Polypterus senegalus]XP_039613549.1 DDB1- and CUL4-associated factor 17 [Polypterus senegalus]
MSFCTVQSQGTSENCPQPPLSSRNTGSTKTCNVCILLFRRSSGIFRDQAGVFYRKNMMLLCQLMCQDTTVFKNVWMKRSKCPVAYEKGRIFFENYRCCYNSIGVKPHRLYELPKCSKVEKIQDALLCECPIGETLSTPADSESCLLALTTNNWLHRYSIKTGKLLGSVYLSSQCKFRYLSWDIPQETLVIKSVQNKLTPLARQAGVVQPSLLCLAVFQVLPLTLLWMLEISKNVFGNNIIDATISHGILIVTYSMGLVRLYSFKQITEKFMLQKSVLGQKFEKNGCPGLVGLPPFGIPFNIQITEPPLLLLEVSCLENALQIGGFPWHYIVTPNKKQNKGIYHICSLKDDLLAKNGIQEMNCCSMESDWIYFHPDDSGRIIHVGPGKINMLKLTEIHDSQYQVMQDYIIVAARENKANQKITVTSSGRVVKKRYNQLDDDPEQETFKIVEYEDELDLLATVAVTQTEADGKALVRLHDNQTGVLIKEINLEESWDVTHSNELFFDRDTIVHLENLPNRNYTCYVYKMIRHFQDED